MYLSINLTKASISDILTIVAARAASQSPAIYPIIKKSTKTKPLKLEVNSSKIRTTMHLHSLPQPQNILREIYAAE